MKSLVVYESQYGNTKQIAQAIGTQLAAAGAARVVGLDSPDAFDTEGIDLLVVGGPTQGHGPSARLRGALQHLPVDTITGLTVAAFDTRVAGPKFLTGSAAGAIARQLEAKGAGLARPPASFLVRGREGPLVDGELVRAEAWAAALRDEVGAEAPVAHS